VTSLSESFEAQRALSRNGSVIGYDQRMEALDKLLAMTLEPGAPWKRSWAIY
jgi:hypothetical protein